MNKKKILYEWIIIPAVGSIVIAMFMETSAIARGDLGKFFESVIVSFSFWTFLANGNGYVVDKIDKRWTWLEAPVTRSIVGLLAMFVVTILISTVILYLHIVLYYGYTFQEVWTEMGFTMYLMPISITLVVSLWLHGRGFLMEWREAATKVERLKAEGLKSKFESLRNQVNPHFLFNSLNALSSLVYDDQKKAVDFIQKLSDVYRYVLDHQNDEVVPLQKEVDFLKSFVFLNKIRFGDNLKVSFENLDYISPDAHVPPLSLQMLMENCIKHNEISNDRNLEISVSLSEEAISIRNNLNPKIESDQESTGIGLNNILQRYDILTDRKVQVNKSIDGFLVSLPVLKTA